MTDNSNERPEAAGGSLPSRAQKHSFLGRVWQTAQFLISLGLTVGFLVYLLRPAKNENSSEPAVRPASKSEVVEVVGPGLIRVQPESPLDKKLQVVAVQERQVSDPMLVVTGRVAASLRPGTGGGSDYWQFDLPETLTSFTDWQKARADIVFTETQLKSVRQLGDARLDAQQKVVARLEKLVSAGTDSAKDLAAERANLIQVEITGRKDLHEAETAVRVAKRAEALLGRQLQILGLDPNLLLQSTIDVDIVLAEVPESRLSRVKIGQGCQATFLGLPNETFRGKVNSIAPVLSKERRSLRVLFLIDDPKDKLRPGMFAEIGLGTDPRKTLMARTEGLLHVSRSDYLLASSEKGVWRAVEVQAGEPHNGDVEILSGIKAGEKIIGSGAILLKPLVVRSLQVNTALAAESKP